MSEISIVFEVQNQICPGEAVETLVYMPGTPFQTICYGPYNVYGCGFKPGADPD
jgi:hypothetical protein